MAEDRELYQLLGRLEGKLDSISGLLTTISRRIDRLENEVKDQREELSGVKQIQAKHAVIVTIAATVFSAIVVHFVKGG